MFPNYDKDLVVEVVVRGRLLVNTWLAKALASVELRLAVAKIRRLTGKKGEFLCPSDSAVQQPLLGGGICWH